MHACLSRPTCRECLGVQAAVVSNTQALVQRNIAAGAMRTTEADIPCGTAISPCGQLLACTRGETLVVQHRRTWQQTAQPMPSPSAAHEYRACWSQDSTRLAVLCARGVYTTTLASWTWQLVMEPRAEVVSELLASWAPSAQSIAVFQVMEPCTLLSLCQASGAGPLVVKELELELQFANVVWAANSTALALISKSGLAILDTATHGLRSVPLVWGHADGVVAWSPASWAVPHLLCIVRSGEALLIDHEAALKGRCEDLVPGELASDLAWGERGVLVLTDCSLWLFGFRSTAIGLVLDVQHQMRTTLRLSTPMLSPDHVHVSMLQACLKQPNLDDVVILNLESGHLALYEMQDRSLVADRLPVFPRCSWTSAGFSLIVTLSSNNMWWLSYKFFRFVCKSQQLARLAVAISLQAAWCMFVTLRGMKMLRSNDGDPVHVTGSLGGLFEGLARLSS